MDATFSIPYNFRDCDSNPWSDVAVAAAPVEATPAAATAPAPTAETSTEPAAPAPAAETAAAPAEKKEDVPVAAPVATA